MGIWENLGMGGYRGFSRPAARLLQQASPNSKHQEQ